MATYKSAVESAAQQESEGVTRENRELRTQLEELQRQFDTTTAKNQEEYNGYLVTVERLKEEVGEGVVIGLQSTVLF